MPDHAGHSGKATEDLTRAPAIHFMMQFKRKKQVQVYLHGVPMPVTLLDISSVNDEVEQTVFRSDDIIVGMFKADTLIGWHV